MEKLKFAPELRAEVAAYAMEHSARAASEKFGIELKNIYNFLAAAKKKEVKASKKPVEKRPEVITIRAEKVTPEFVVICSPNMIRKVLGELNG